MGHGKCALSEIVLVPNGAILAFLPLMPHWIRIVPFSSIIFIVRDRFG